MAIKYKGGKCFICGYNKCTDAFDFHHIGIGKEFGISKDGLTRSWTRVKREIEKCVLLCANCHREIPNGITQLPAARRVEKQGELREA